MDFADYSECGETEMEIQNSRGSYCTVNFAAGVSC